MHARITHAVDTKFYWRSGLQVPRRFLPANIAIKFFINKMVEKAFVEANPYRIHRCTATCGRIANMVIGNQTGVALKEILRGELANLVCEFEDHMDLTLKRVLGPQQIKSVAIMFVPCAKKLEILDSAIYL